MVNCGRCGKPVMDNTPLFITRQLPKVKLCESCFDAMDSVEDSLKPAVKEFKQAEKTYNDTVNKAWSDWMAKGRAQ